MTSKKSNHSSTRPKSLPDITSIMHLPPINGAHATTMHTTEAQATTVHSSRLPAIGVTNFDESFNTSRRIVPGAQEQNSQAAVATSYFLNNKVHPLQRFSVPKTAEIDMDGASDSDSNYKPTPPHTVRYPLGGGSLSYGTGASSLNGPYYLTCGPYGHVRTLIQGYSCFTIFFWLFSLISHQYLLKTLHLESYINAQILLLPEEARHQVHLCEVHPRSVNITINCDKFRRFIETAFDVTYYTVQVSFIGTIMYCVVPFLTLYGIYKYKRYFLVPDLVSDVLIIGVVSIHGLIYVLLSLFIKPEFSVLVVLFVLLNSWMIWIFYAKYRTFKYIKAYCAQI